MIVVVTFMLAFVPYLINQINTIYNLITGL